MRPVAGRTKLAWWFVNALIAGVIFFLSSRPSPGLGSAPLDQLASVIAHVSLYASLAFAFQRASGWRDFKGAALTVLLVVLYGISDEVHQSFVPERDASLVDVGLDLVGAVIGTTAGVRSTLPSGDRRQIR